MIYYTEAIYNNNNNMASRNGFEQKIWDDDVFKYNK